jgi:hypothetical protein
LTGRASATTRIVRLAYLAGLSLRSIHSRPNAACFGAAVAAGGEQFNRAAAIGFRAAAESRHWRVIGGGFLG